MSVGNRIIHLFEGEQKGLFSQANPSLIPDGFLANLRGGDLNTYGMITKAMGRANTATGLTDGRARRLAFFDPVGGTKVLTAFQAGALSVWPNTGVWADIATGVTEEPMDILQAGNYQFFFQRSDNVRYYDGVTLTTAGDTNTDLPRTRYAVYMLGWLLPFGSAAFPDGLYFGTNGTPLTGWNRTSNRLTIGAGEGGDSTGAKPWSNQDLILTKETRIYAVTIDSATPSAWPITPITSDIGCISGRTLQQVGQDFFFLSQPEGVLSLLQSAQDKKRGSSDAISYPVDDLIRRINWQYAKDVACATFWRGQYILSVPLDSSQVNNVTLVFNLRSKGWSRIDYGFADFSIGRFDSNPKLYSAYGVAATGGVNLEESGYDDRGAAVSWIYETKRVSGPNGGPMPHIWKRGGEVEFFFESTGAYAVTIDAAIDGGGYTNLGTMTLTGTLPQLPIDLPFNLADQNLSRGKFNLDVLGRYRDIQFRAQNAETGAQIKLVRAIASMIPMEYVRDL